MLYRITYVKAKLLNDIYFNIGFFYLKNNISLQVLNFVKYFFSNSISLVKWFLLSKYPRFSPFVLLSISNIWVYLRDKKENENFFRLKYEFDRNQFQIGVIMNIFLLEIWSFHSNTCLRHRFLGLCKEMHRW